MTHLTSITATRIPPSAPGYLNDLYNWTAQKVHRVMAFFFFMNWQDLDPARLQAAHTRHMQGYNPQPLAVPNIDAIRIPATNTPTGNVVVICVNGPYEKADPHKWWKPLWEGGADIVLWNSTQIDSHQMATDLEAVLRSLQGRTIAVKASCGISDPAIKAVAALNDPNIHLVLDRAFGDAKAVARSTTVWAKLPLPQMILNNHFHCDGIHHVANVPGQMLFMEAEHDQMLGSGPNTQTQALYQAAPSSQRQYHYMKGADHWSGWDKTTYDYVLNFLRNLNVVGARAVDTTSYAPPRLSFFASKILPSLIRAWF